MAIGRPEKLHKTATGEKIPGLYNIPGTNRWRIKATVQRFTEVDEACPYRISHPRSKTGRAQLADVIDESSTPAEHASWIAGMKLAVVATPFYSAVVPVRAGK
jgi:hypothetical protein